MVITLLENYQSITNISYLQNNQQQRFCVSQVHHWLNKRLLQGMHTRRSAIAERPRGAACCWVFWLVA